jgi:hypothetical protein
VNLFTSMTPAQLQNSQQFYCHANIALFYWCKSLSCIHLEYSHIKELDGHCKDSHSLCDQFQLINLKGTQSHAANITAYLCFYLESVRGVFIVWEPFYWCIGAILHRCGCEVVNG